MARIYEVWDGKEVLVKDKKKYKCNKCGTMDVSVFFNKTDTAWKKRWVCHNPKCKYNETEK